MTLTAAKVSDLVQEQLTAINDLRLKAYLQSRLITPSPHLRNWDYGTLGEQFTCWTVAIHIPSQTCLLYCELGFGPAHPWGLGWLDRLWIGPDSSWYPTLLKAYLASWANAEIES